MPLPACRGSAPPPGVMPPRSPWGGAKGEGKLHAASMALRLPVHRGGEGGSASWIHIPGHPLGRRLPRQPVRPPLAPPFCSGAACPAPLGELSSDGREVRKERRERNWENKDEWHGREKDTT